VNGTNIEIVICVRNSVKLTRCFQLLKK